MKTQYTPGPWKVADYGDCLAIECCVRGVEHTVVTDQFCYPNFAQNKDPEKIANANLIAAAPTMFEALQFVVNKLEISGNMSVAAKEFYKEAVDKATEAIAKATGETITSNQNEQS